MITKTIITALSESNHIEDVWDADSLNQAIKAWEYVIEEDALNSKVILATHEILMAHQDLRPNEIGEFRKVPIWIGGHQARPWYAVPELVRKWCYGANMTVADGQTMPSIIQDHIDFEAIHPFVDGNGRTGRILLNWQRVKCRLNPIIIREAQKEEYYAWFE
jgi:Fic family protein